MQGLPPRAVWRRVLCQRRKARGRRARPGPDGERVVGSQSGAEFAAVIAAGEGEFLERMWEPQVRVHGDLASLWAPYDFRLDGELGHCGIDAFQLLRDADGWRIAHVVYTVQREGCPDSPLGPARPGVRAPGRPR